MSISQLQYAVQFVCRILNEEGSKYNFMAAINYIHHRWVVLGYMDFMSIDKCWIPDQISHVTWCGFDTRENLSLAGIRLRLEMMKISAEHQ